MMDSSDKLQLNSSKTLIHRTPNVEIPCAVPALASTTVVSLRYPVSHDLPTVAQVELSLTLALQ